MAKRIARRSSWSINSIGRALTRREYDSRTRAASKVTNPAGSQALNSSVVRETGKVEIH